MKSKNNFLKSVVVLSFYFFCSHINAQTYRDVFGWDNGINNQLKSFLNWLCFRIMWNS